MKLNKKQFKGIHIKHHILFSYLIIILCVIVLLWSFQILYLQKFYETLRIYSAEKTVHSMIDNFEKTEIETEKQFTELMTSFDTLASEADCSFMIVNNYYRVLYENNKSMSYQFTRKDMDYLQTNANLKDGYFMTSVDGAVNNSKVVIICSVLKDTDKNIIGYLMLNSLITPVNTTITMLKNSTYIITVILIIISIILSVIMSQSIAYPIQKITDSAEKMAKGEFKTEFDGGSYAETKQLAKTLNYASSEISKIDELQRDLIANVSHDLRTPLTMIKAYAEMIRDLSGEKKEKREEHLKIIIDETDRLALLVSDMLDLSKLENGSQTLNYTSFDMNSKLKDIIERYKGFSEPMGYKINFSDDTPVLVKCDVVKIEQVIYNLINNAVNYTGEDKQVYVSQEIEEDFVKVTIRDTGKGISEENIHQIFDKYYRCEKTKREVVGTGLGLSIVKAILKKHNFPFGVQSTLGEGTTFWFKVKRDKESICI
ncbi:MAG: HAMP domain-containing sensor histidine kinase [Oscillospiraceae bacterium]|nr:HAMP domain-containing sensor histidine kinase [Oscillospiraceae bacterium]